MGGALEGFWMIIKWILGGIDAIPRALSLFSKQYHSNYRKTVRAYFLASFHCNLTSSLQKRCSVGFQSYREMHR